MRETIFASATPPGRGGVAVVRISGPAATTALRRLQGEDTLPAPRLASVRRLKDPVTDAVLDEALVLRFAGPASFTGEDVVELHLHGGRAVSAGVMASLAAMPELRPAEAGEFTRRAVENGRLDLTQAEGIADLVDAETSAQARQALRQLEGGLSRLYDSWSDRLARTLAYQEAEIDFPDEDLPEGLSATMRPEVEALIAGMAAHLDDGGRGERLREGVAVAIIGAPNAGKSSLLNALARRDVAIVSDLAGTTRDVIEVHLDLGGLPVILWDTAGLRETADRVEAEGIRRALERARSADLKLALFDASAAPDSETLALLDENCLVLVTKVDEAGAVVPEVIAGHPVIAVSVAAAGGLAALLSALGAAVADRAAPGAAPGITRVRHRTAVSEAREALVRALTAPLPELAAEDVRLALREIGRITGRVDVEDLLDIIFRDFCIGK
ncbi:tRNA uridine-5-carboxymethylaminomethyl(34) synthesis GTPase MnmE [Radicibacter daui]|uniref:tRNA uridine-5-carboxymethylaminomethyl(34) synthesis GTPase MnmE n=1 Tax=Radicibacter daui TaxID=3064829 RepID=UPI004046D189